jgi:superfamily II DNA or RNA helicase
MSDESIPNEEEGVNHTGGVVEEQRGFRQTMLPFKSMTTITTPTTTVASDAERFKRLVGVTLVPRGFMIPVALVENRWFVERAQSDLTYHKPENKYNKYAGVQPPLRVYLRDETHIIVPKFYGMAQLRGRKVPIINVNVDGLPMCAEAVYRADRPLKEERRRPQQSATRYAIDSLTKQGGCMLVMPVGTGKTNCGIYTCVQLGRKTLWLAHRSNLMEQAAARAAEFAPGLRIGYLYADVCDVDDKDIVFATVQSLGQKVYDSALLRQFGTVVLDEAHHGAAEMFVDALWQTAAPRMLALTATPERKDGLTEVIDHFFSRNRFVVEPLLPDGIVLHVRVLRLKMRSALLDDDMCDSKFRAKQQRRIDALMREERLNRDEALERLSAQLAQKPDDVSELGYSGLCSALARISSRNALLCAMIKRALVTRDAGEISANDLSTAEMRDTAFAALHDRERSNVLVSYIEPSSNDSTQQWSQRKQAPIDQISADQARDSMQQIERQVIFLTVNVKHVQCMRERLIRSGVPSHMIGSYYGEVSPEERERALHKRIVLCTYAMAEEGLDVPTANTLIEAAPRGDSSQQTIGRILRDKMTPLVQPTIVTLVDDWCGMAMGMYRHREQQYRKYKCSLQTTTIDALDERANEAGVLRTAATIAALRAESRLAQQEKRQQKKKENEEENGEKKKSKPRTSAAEKRARSDELRDAKRQKRSALVSSALQSGSISSTTTGTTATSNADDDDGGEANTLSSDAKDAADDDDNFDDDSDK